ncbi:MAG: hypothetical protein IIA14_00415 [SAR324 cluster bacterium]|nr:hypothetical protein [SAR324 cluster bacterium]
MNRAKARISSAPPAAPDCGLKYLPRDVSIANLQTMVEGAALMRKEVAG